MKFYTKEELGHMIHSELIDVIIEMQEKCNKLGRNNIILSLDIEQKAKEIEKLKEDNARYTRSIEALEKENEKLKTENKNLAEGNYVLNVHINEYEFVIKESDKEKAKLKDEIERWNKSYAYLVEQNGVLEKKAEDADACYKGRVVQCEELRKENERLKNELDALKGSIVKRNNRIHELEHDIECRNKDIEEKNKFIKHLEEKIDKLEAPMFESNFFVNRLNKNLTKFDSKSSVPCSEAIKQLEKKVDDIPCIKNVKFIDQFDNDPKIPTPEKVWKDDTTIINYLCRGIKKNPPYNEIAEHMMRKYKALRNAGFDHDDAMSLIPMWCDE